MDRTQIQFIKSLLYISIFLNFLSILFSFYQKLPPTRDMRWAEVTDALWGTVPQGINTIVLGVATSTLAAVAFYFIYQGRVDSALREMALKEGARVAQQRFQEYFSRYVPQDFFQAVPNEEWGEGVVQALYSRIRESSEYWYYGDNAKRTTYEICRIWSVEDEYIGEPRAYHLMLAYPKKDVYFLRQSYEKGPRISKEEESYLIARAEQEINELFYTLTALYDRARDDLKGSKSIIRQMRIGLYEDPPFYRYEMVDQGLFLMYYLRGKNSLTFYYDRKSEVAESVKRHFEILFRDASRRSTASHPLFLPFSESSYTEEQFTAQLRSLGCTMSLDVLRERYRHRFDNYKKESRAIQVDGF
jgi:hypothetical protein